MHLEKKKIHRKEYLPFQIPIKQKFKAPDYFEEFQKSDLKAMMMDVPSKKFPGLLEIIEEEDFANSCGKEVEVDLDNLKTTTLQKLWTYCKKNLAFKKRVQGGKEKKNRLKEKLYRLQGQQILSNGRKGKEVENRGKELDIFDELDFV